MAADLPELVVLCRYLASDELATIEDVAKEALAGRPQFARRYAGAYLSLLDRMLTYFQPRIHHLAASVLLTQAADALVSSWVEQLGPGMGVAVALVERLRRSVRRDYIEEVGTLSLSGARTEPAGRSLLDETSEAGFDRFRRYLDRELRLAGRRAPINRIQDLFDLSDTEMARLFGVTRQAVQKWLRAGKVPAARRAKAQTILQIAELLARNLKQERIPGIVRKPADWFDGASILDRIAQDRQDEVLERVRDSFDWSRPA